MRITTLLLVVALANMTQASLVFPMPVSMSPPGEHFISQGEWTILSVDNTSGSGYHCSIAVDGNNWPHVSYQNWNDEVVRYAQWSGNSWERAIVDNDVGTGYVTSIMVDDENIPHISYGARTDYMTQVRYAFRNESGWQVATVDTIYQGNTISFSSIDLDSNQSPHVGYSLGQLNDSLRSAARQNGTWHTDIIGHGFTYSNAFSLDSQDEPHIAFLGWAHLGERVRYGHKNESGWWVHDVNSSSGLGAVRLAVSPNDIPSISYSYDKPSGWFGFKTAWLEGGSFVEEDLGVESMTGNNAIAFDSLGNPHLAYFEIKEPMGATRLVHASREAGIWSFEYAGEVDYAGPLGQQRWIGLAIDSNDMPHIVFTERNETTLRYATKANIWGGEIAANAGGPYEGNEGDPITFDASGSTGPEGVALEYRWDFDGDGVWDTPFSFSPIANHTWTDDYTGTAYVKVQAPGGDPSAIEIIGSLDGGGWVIGEEQRAQSFFATFELLTQVSADVSLNRNEVPNAPLTLSIRSDINGSDLTSVQVKGDGMPVGLVENWVIFDVPDIVLTPGNTYWVVLYSNADNAAYEPHATLDAYPNGTAWGIGAGGGWVPSPTLDLRMIISGVSGTVSAIDGASVTVHNVAPTPEWTSRSSDGMILNPPYPEGKEILFEATVYDPGIYDTFTYDWDLGDGTILLDAGPSVTHTYGDDEIYIVVLTVTDDDGGVGIDDTPPLDTTNENPVASIDMPFCIFSEGTSPCEAIGQFTDPGWLDTHSAVWDYGDGTYGNAVLTSENDPPDATGMNITSHIYGDNGVYTITFTVLDDDGGVGTASAEAQVINLPPTLNVTLPPSVNEGEDFVLGITATDPGSDDIILSIDWGDGTSETMIYYNNGVGPDPPNSGEGVYPFTVYANITHVYGDNGGFTVDVTVEDDDGGVGTATLVLDVLNLPAAVELAESFTGDENSDIGFQAAASDPGSDDLTFVWDWGDGTSDTAVFYNDGTGPDPPQSPWGAYPFDATHAVSHLWGDNGDFIVTLTVTDDDGGVTVEQTLVTVNNVAPTIAGIAYYLNASFAFRIAGEKWHNVEIHLYEDGTEVGYASITRYPGSPNDQMVALGDVSVDFSKTYSAVAYYTPEDDPINGQIWGATPAWVILEYEDGEERIHHTFNVRHEDTWTWVIDDFSAYFLGHNITFMATASDPGSDDLTFSWDWGDGNTIENVYYNNGIGLDPYPSPEVNPISVTDTVQHSYSVAGTYAITLTVTDDDGGIGLHSVSLTL